jgi:hypothetical protein
VEEDMSSRIWWGPVIAGMAMAGSAHAADPAFRAGFEARLRRGSFAVVTRPGIPTVPVHGLDGKQTDAYYSVDVKRGDWKPSQGFLDLNQVANDQLAAGEVMEVVDVTYKDKDHRIDIRLVSRDAHEVVRTGGAGQTNTREPVGTNFKFFFPFPIDSVLALPAAVDYVEGYLRLFRREDEARAYASLIAPRAAPAPASAAAPKVEPQQIKPGMTPLEVLDVLGKPDRELTYGPQSKWTYRDVVVVFENGRVKEVRF